MATLKERSDNWNATSLIHRDHRHDKSDGYEETPHKKNKSDKPKKVRKGCPGNNDGAHVYVWVVLRWAPRETGSQADHLLWPSYYTSPYTWWDYDRHKNYLESYEAEYCAGCYKRSRRASRKVAR